MFSNSYRHMLCNFKSCTYSNSNIIINVNLCAVPKLKYTY